MSSTSTDFPGTSPVTLSSDAPDQFDARTADLRDQTINTPIEQRGPVTRMPRGSQKSSVSFGARCSNIAGEIGDLARAGMNTESW